MINVEQKIRNIGERVKSFFQCVTHISSFRLFVMNLSIRHYLGSGIGKEMPLGTLNSVIPGENK
jgi:hypothetical protein